MDKFGIRGAKWENCGVSRAKVNKFGIRGAKFDKHGISGAKVWEK